ncbi:MAG: hypothetical protein WEF50_04615 [Myxococcota bacterium]
MATKKRATEKRAAATRLLQRLPKPTRAQLEELNRLQRVEVLELQLLVDEMRTFVKNARSLRAIRERFGLPANQGRRRDDREAFDFYAWAIGERPKRTTEPYPWPELERADARLELESLSRPASERNGTSVTVGELQTYEVPMTLLDAQLAVHSRYGYRSERAAREGLRRGKAKAVKFDAALAEVPLPPEVRPAAVLRLSSANRPCPPRELADRTR